MTVLSAILPGARQVRAPLAAGATWLLTIWLAIEPGLAESTKATGIYASLVRLSDATGNAVVLAVIGFLAYMLGSVTTSAVLALARDALPKAHRGNPVRSLVLARVFAADARLREHTEIASLDEAAARPEARDLFAPPAEEPFVRDGDNPVQITENLEVRIRRYGSWREAKLQLLSKDPQLYAELDRHEAERELRLALLAPLLALTIVVAVRVGPWYASLALAVTGLALLWVLKVQAAMAREWSERVLLDVIRNGTVTVPLLEQLDHDVDLLIQRLDRAEANADSLAKSDQRRREEAPNHA
jgi:hypothetical protein